MITPYRIDIPQQQLDDLTDRLDRVRWPDALPGDEYGAPLGQLKEVVDHWRHKYDWREQEARLNEIPQYVTDIDGANVHFLHIRSQDPDALPLVMTHGWPGSIVEFLDVIGQLTDFHLVIPSIPGFGLSGPTREAGWGVRRIAAAWATLMERLGYERYGAQGGDWGSVISRHLAAQAPDAVVGVHLNYLPTIGPTDGLSAEDQRRAAATEELLRNPAPYMSLQATSPLTLGYALADSPVGQLAWILDRVNAWQDPATPIGLDRVLTNVMLYWLTNTASSSARLHFESFNGRGGPLPCPVPVGVAVLPRDITLAVRPLAERLYDIVHWTEFEHGGHFAALEVPDALATDIRAFFHR